MGLVQRRKKPFHDELDDGVPPLSGGVPSLSPPVGLGNFDEVQLRIH